MTFRTMGELIQTLKVFRFTEDDFSVGKGLPLKNYVGQVTPFTADVVLRVRGPYGDIGFVEAEDGSIVVLMSEFTRTWGIERVFTENLLRRLKEVWP